MNKVVVLDSGFFTHKAIFSWGAEKKRLLLKGSDDDPMLPASYTYLMMYYSALKKIGIDKDDIIIIAQDGRNSWRKAFLESYKGNREKGRQAHEHINWGLQYSLISKTETKLNRSTNWHFIKLDNIFNYSDLVLSDEGQKFKLEEYGNIAYDVEFGIEADDIQAVCPKFFKDKEVILVTIDEDISQLYYYDNVKIFNPNLRSPTNKSKRGFYNIIEDPKKIITKKIRSGDISDNIIVDQKNDSERDVAIRRFIIDLLKLPTFVEKPIINALNSINYNKKISYDDLPFKNSLAKKFDTIYDQSNLITWKDSLKIYLKKKIKTKEKNSKKTPEELYEKNKSYKKLKDRLDELKKKKVKV